MAMVCRRPSPWLLVPVLTAAVAALSASSWASGFQLVEQNASGLGNAYAGQAAGARDASTVFFNPAAMTRLKGWNVMASVEPIGISTKFANTSSTGPRAGSFAFPVALGDAGGDAGGWIPVPNFYAAGRAAEKLYVGVGVNVPFGLQTDWDATWIGRFHAKKSKVQALNVNPTVAYQVHERVSIGAGLNWQRLDAELGQQVAYGGLAFAGAAQALAAQGIPAAAQPALLGAIQAQLGSAGLALEGPAVIEGDSHAWGWNAGVLVKLSEQAHVGVSYRAKIKHEVEDATATFTGAPRFAETSALPGVGAIGAGLNRRFASGPVQTTIELPDTLSVAVAVEGEKVQVLADWTWTGWDVLQSLDITRTSGDALSSVPLRFENTWRAGLGLSYAVNEEWTVRVGTAYDKSPVQDEFRTPRLPDDNRVWAAGGLQWRVREKLHVDVGYAHLFVGDAPSNLPNQASPTSTPVGALVGSYDEKVDIIGAQLSLRF